MSLNEQKLVPDGWSRTEKTRKSGRTDVNFYSPNGTLFRSKKQLLRHIEDKKLSYKIEEFKFNLSENISTSHATDRKVDVLAEEVFSSQAGDINSEELEVLTKSVSDLSESCVQLQHEKNQTEILYSKLQKEADETIETYEEEIKKLKDENHKLNNQLKNKDDEIASLKSCIESIEDEEKINIEMKRKECNNCTNLQNENLILNNTILKLKREHVQLMETVLPCPQLDKGLLRELEIKNSQIKILIEKSNDDQVNQNEILRVLQLDFEKLYSENQKLKNINADLSLCCEEMQFQRVDTKKTNYKSKPEALKQNKDGVLLSNRYSALSEQACPVSEQNYRADIPRDVSIYEEIGALRTSEQKKRKGIISPKNTTYNKQLKKRNILILADSHGRKISSNMMEIWPTRSTVISSIIKPNATITEVTKNIGRLTKSFTKTDHVLVMGGSNDNVVNGEEQLIDCYKKLIEKTTHTNIIVTGLPFRHHTPEINDRVGMINKKVEQLVVNSAHHSTFLPINDLSRKLYTKHGLHFNSQGKKKIAQMVRDHLFQNSQLLSSDLLPACQLPVGWSASTPHPREPETQAPITSMTDFPPLPSLNHQQQPQCVNVSVLIHSSAEQGNSQQTNNPTNSQHDSFLEIVEKGQQIV